MLKYQLKMKLRTAEIYEYFFSEAKRLQIFPLFLPKIPLPGSQEIFFPYGQHLDL